MTIKKIYLDFEDKIKGKKIFIIGAGGLGCVVSDLFARMNINFTIIDNDIVDNTNLERQILYNKSDLLKKKVYAIKEKLKEFSIINAVDKRLNEKNIEILKKADLVIDCTDNMETRKIINRYCIRNNIPWIYSGAIGSIGTIYFINKNACFECINQNKYGETSCEAGIMNSIVAIVGALTVNIALQYLIERKKEDKLIRINLKTNELIKVSTKKNPKCMACGKKEQFINSNKKGIQIN